MDQLSKVLLAIVILTLCLIGAGMYTNYALAKDANELEKRIVAIQDNIKNGNWEDAMNELIKFKDYWSKKQHIWAILQNHFEIDNINTSLTRLTDYIYTKSLSLALSESSVLMQYIQHIPKNVAITLGNIF
ncbi:MAG TPA: DUF4363 family protein [Clostridiaceae bacterium]|nr:DUF4363 family protein [Clostridiaceae bacterium]